MFKAVFPLFILSTLSLLDVIIAEIEFDVIKYGSREFNDMPIYIENHRTGAGQDQAERKVIVHWTGRNETYTQVYFEALNWDYASFDDPWSNTYRAKREFTLQLYGKAEKMFVNLIVFGFTDKPLPSSENDIFSDVVSSGRETVFIKK